MLTISWYCTRYDTILTRRAIEATQPNFQPCTHPGCNSGQIHETGHESPIMTCSSCFKQTCFTHKRPWHSGMTCAAVDEAAAHVATDEVDQTLLIIGKTTKQCPKCKIHIEKNNGCDHMTCMCFVLLLGWKQIADSIPLGSHCRHEFCWRCLANFQLVRQYGNTAHTSECPFHSSNLPRSAPLFPSRYLHDDGQLLPKFSKQV
jgi:hypothetical protein